MRLATLFAVLVFGLCGCAIGQEGTQNSANGQGPTPDLSLYQPEPYVQVEHAEWTKDAVLYQINTRQFTPEGTFQAAEAQLPRLKKLGVDILWLMPIQPIGEINRKGSMGSPYSVKDYFGVNPELGTEDDFRSFVDAAHSHGFQVILDWVANHSAWDNPLVTEHPEWYDTDWKGEFHPTPWTDWADIIDFDYSEPGLREYMTRALRYWVEEFDVDGYRLDVAGYVPLDFWEQARRELDDIKPVFLLAEWEQRDLHRRAFDASYGWSWKETAQRIAKGEADAGAMTGWLGTHISTWPRDGYRMLYTENHDQNAWDGSTGEIYGEAYRAILTLSFVIEGIPLIHNGQEVGNQNRLEFFERDPIAWGDYSHPDGDFIRLLIAVRKSHKALHNGLAGGKIEPVVTDNPRQILSFARESDGQQVVVLANLSSDPAHFTLTDGPVTGDYSDMLTDKVIALGLTSAFNTHSLEPWQVRVLDRNNLD